MANPSGRFNFNPSLAMPIVDILVAVVLIASTGYFWFHTKGQERLAAIRDELAAARQENAADLAENKAALMTAESDYEQTVQLRDAKEQFLAFLKEQTEVERNRIEESRGFDDQYTGQVLDLRTEIQRGRDRRLAYRTDIMGTEGKIAEEQQAIASLEAQARERDSYIDQLDGWILAAEQRLQQDPPSRFPEKSGLASYLEIRDPNESLVFNLSHELYSMGMIDLGLLGSLGVATDGEASLKEGGFYANLPISSRRASVDLETGVSQLQSRAQDMSDTSPFAGASLRVAPLGKERFFVVAGTRYSHEDIALRLGLAIGRR
jgi:hypothetical protein